MASRVSKEAEGENRPALFCENTSSTAGTDLLHGLIDGDLALLHHGHDGNALRVRHPHLVGSEFRGGLEGGKEKKETGAETTSAPKCIRICRKATRERWRSSTVGYLDDRAGRWKDYTLLNGLWLVLVSTLKAFEGSFEAFEEPLVSGGICEHRARGKEGGGGVYDVRRAKGGGWRKGAVDRFKKTEVLLYAGHAYRLRFRRCVCQQCRESL